MSLRGYNLLFDENFITNGAVLSFSKTEIGTGRILCLVDDLGVSLLINNRLRDGYSTAHGTMLTLGQAGGRASCLYSRVDDLGVRQCGNFLRAEGFAAIVTSHGYGTRSTAGRIHRGSGLVFVIQSINGGIRIRMITNRASVSGIAASRTGRSGYDSVVGVTQCRNIFLRSRCIVATRAMRAFGQAGCGTSGCHSGIRHHVVPQLRLLYVSSIIATRAGYVCIPTVFSTGGSLCLVRNLIVAKLCLFYVSSVVATRAGHVCIPTDVSTGGSLCLVRNLIMTKRINLGYFRLAIASGAVVRLATRSRTGRRHILRPFFGISMIKRIDR